MNEFDLTENLEYQKRILDWAEPIILSLPSALETPATPIEDIQDKVEGGEKEAE